jgi:hypothetical protein
MSALLKCTRTGFQASDKLTFRMRQTYPQSVDGNAALQVLLKRS